MHKLKRKDEILRKPGKRAQKRLDVALSTKFTPRFLDDADTRLHVVRLMRKRVTALMDDAGGHESVQRAMLVKHATFMHIRLESMETEALEGKPINWGEFTQAINALCGLLGRLGLEKRMKSAKDLTTYLAERNGGK